MVYYYESSADKSMGEKLMDCLKVPLKSSHRKIHRPSQYIVNHTVKMHQSYSQKKLFLRYYFLLSEAFFSPYVEGLVCSQTKKGTFKCHLKFISF